MAESDVTIKGTLEGGIAAIGGETTGYRLNNVSIESVEVDVSELDNADNLDGQNVTLNGHFDVVEGVESGKRLVFKAHSTS